MDFEEKKQEMKTDVIPFIIAIPALMILNAEVGLGLPLTMVITVPIIGYIAFVIINLIGYWLWKI